MLGLETHDVTLPNYKLQPGNVFTIEPGLYLEEEGIGIRIDVYKRQVSSHRPIFIVSEETNLLSYPQT